MKNTWLFQIIINPEWFGKIEKKNIKRIKFIEK